MEGYWECLPKPFGSCGFGFFAGLTGQPCTHGEGFALRTRKRVDAIPTARGACLGGTRAALVAIVMYVEAIKERGGIIGAAITHRQSNVM
jgi:hypothetical protein